MKIIKTRKRTEIEISAIELRIMLIAKDDRIKECANDILTIVKKANQCNDRKDDDMFNLYSGISTKKAPKITERTLSECSDVLKSRLKSYEEIATDCLNGDFKKSIFKSDDDIRQEEREKTIDKVINIINKYLVFGEERVSCGAAELCYRIKKLN